ncbi:hypothetical protein Tco_0345006 [Tanacetum coccineum]
MNSTRTWHIGVPVFVGLCSCWILDLPLLQACRYSELRKCRSVIQLLGFEEEDGKWICFLGGNNSSGTKKYWGSNSSDGGNTGDGVKIADGVIGSGNEIVFIRRVKRNASAEWGINDWYRSIVKNIHRGKSILNIGSRAVGRRHLSETLLLGLQKKENVVIVKVLTYIAAEANLGYYFMDTTITIIENDSKETLFKRYVIIHLKSEFYTAGPKLLLQCA